MNFDYKPKETSELQGKAVLRSLSVEERLEVSEVLAGEAAVLNSDSEAEQAKLSIKLMKECLGFVKTHIVSVDMKNKAGKEFKSYEDLNDDESGHPILMDMSKVFMERMDLGKLLNA